MKMSAMAQPDSPSLGPDGAAEGAIVGSESWKEIARVARVGAGVGGMISNLQVVNCPSSEVQKFILPKLTSGP